MNKTTFKFWVFEVSSFFSLNCSVIVNNTRYHMTNLKLFLLMLWWCLKKCEWKYSLSSSSFLSNKNKAHLLSIVNRKITNYFPFLLWRFIYLDTHTHTHTHSGSHVVCDEFWTQMKWKVKKYHKCHIVSVLVCLLMSLLSVCFLYFASNPLISKYRHFPFTSHIHRVSSQIYDGHVFNNMTYDIYWNYSYVYSLHKYYNNREILRSFSIYFIFYSKNLSL